MLRVFEVIIWILEKIFSTTKTKYPWYSIDPYTLARTEVILADPANFVPKVSITVFNDCTVEIFPMDEDGNEDPYLYGREMADSIISQLPQGKKIDHLLGTHREDIALFCHDPRKYLKNGIPTAYILEVFVKLVIKERTDE